MVVHEGPIDVVIRLGRHPSLTKLARDLFLTFQPLENENKIKYKK